MELEFFLPYIDELKRLTCMDEKKISGYTTIDRFYSSDLFDRNILGVIGEFFRPRYVVKDYDYGYSQTIKIVRFEYKGIQVQIELWSSSFKTPHYMQLNSPIIVYSNMTRSSIKSILSHDTYKSLSDKQQNAIKKAVEAILADPNIFP